MAGKTVEVRKTKTGETRRAGIVMPAFNESASIQKVIAEIPKQDVAEIVVVDNNSTDDTGEVARRAGATVVREPVFGYGAACLKGLASLSDQSEIVVVLDADRSDYPEDLPLLLGPIQRGEADLVIGSRVLGRAEDGALRWNQRLGNKLACGLIRWLYGARYTDMGPFRAITRENLDRLGMEDKTYGWNAEMQVKAIHQGLRILEVPVRYRKRIGRSKISGTIRGTILAGGKIVGTILSYYPSFRRSKRREAAGS